MPKHFIVVSCGFEVFLRCAIPVKLYDPVHEIVLEPDPRGSGSETIHETRI